MLAGGVLSVLLLSLEWLAVCCLLRGGRDLKFDLSDRSHDYGHIPTERGT
jgi:hypothetical protein